MHDIAVVFLLCMCCIYDCHVLQKNAELFYFIFFLFFYFLEFV